MLKDLIHSIDFATQYRKIEKLITHRGTKKEKKEKILTKRQ
jgi:hypothetical protein